MHSSSENPLSVAWFFQGMLLDTTNNPRYSVSVAESGSLQMLSVVNVNADVLGQYSVVVTVDGQNATDSVQLLHPGMAIG